MNSKAYAFFLVKDLTNKTVEALGSDGYLPLDARFSIKNQKGQAAIRAKQLNRTLNKGYIGFNLYHNNKIVDTVIF